MYNRAASKQFLNGTSKNLLNPGLTMWLDVGNAPVLCNGTVVSTTISSHRRNNMHFAQTTDVQHQQQRKAVEKSNQSNPTVQNLSRKPNCNDAASE